MRNPISVDLAELIQNSKGETPESLGPRERILLAALHLFVKQGYFNTNVPDLSKESKCSVGSIYHHFRNKEEVAEALYTAGIASFRAALEKTLRLEADVSELVKGTVIFFLEFTERNMELSKYLWLSRHNEFMSGEIPHPTMVGFDRLGRTLTKAIKGGIRSGKIRPLKAEVLWSVLFGIPLSFARDWLDGINSTRPSEVAPALADAVWRGLQTA